MPRISTIEDGYYSVVSFMRMPSNTYQITYSHGLENVMTIECHKSDIDRRSELFKSTDLTHVFTESTSFTEMVSDEFIDMIKQLPEEWEVAITLQNGILSTVSVFNEIDDAQAYGDFPSYIKLHPTGLVTKVEYHDNGKLHKQVGPASLVTFGGTTHKSYYYCGTKIPNSLIDDGIVDEDDINEEAIVSMTLLGINE
ncbi:hypothetical protein NVP2275O_073 [Vibrio phage 2.275.O._10N.286.54.E11]|nr:hypothetical protein NVP2275O_073 [Vibrio phage 2.275.O._10N.286.54.E11]